MGKFRHQIAGEFAVTARDIYCNTGLKALAKWLRRHPRHLAMMFWV
jgi:hypothetical protein